MKDAKEMMVGAAAGIGTGAGLASATASLSAPAANLGGYVTAQSIAGTVGAGGPWLSAAIAAVGGPVVAGALLSAAVAGLAYGGTKAFSGISVSRRSRHGDFESFMKEKDFDSWLDW